MKTPSHDVFVGLIPLLLGFELILWIILLPQSYQGHADFRQLYAAGYMVRTHHSYQLYDYDAQLGFQNDVVSRQDAALPFLRPAYEALAFVPLSLLPYRSAYSVMLLLNLGLCWFCFTLLRTAAESTWLTAGVFVCYFPVSMALLQGQDSIALLALMAGSLLALQANRDVRAGILLGLGLFKPQLVLPIALLMLAWRRWRFCAGFGFAVAITTLASMLVSGRNFLPIYWQTVQNITFALPLFRMANVRGLVVGLTGSHLSGQGIAEVVFGLSILVFCIVAAGKKHTLESAILCATLISYYLLPHDMTILIIPILTAFRLGDEVLKFVAIACIAAPMLIVVPSYFYLALIPALLLVLFNTFTLCQMSLTCVTILRTSSSSAPPTAP